MRTPSAVSVRVAVLGVVVVAGASSAAPASARVVDRVDPISVAGWGGTGAWLRPVGGADADGRYRRTQLVVLPQIGKFRHVRQKAPQVVPVALPDYADRIVLGNVGEYPGDAVLVHSSAGWSRVALRYGDKVNVAVPYAGSQAWTAMSEFNGADQYATPVGTTSGHGMVGSPPGGQLPFTITDRIGGILGLDAGRRTSGGSSYDGLWMQVGTATTSRFKRVVKNPIRKGVRSGLGPLTATNGDPPPSLNPDEPDPGHLGHISRWIVSRGTASTSIITVTAFSRKVQRSVLPRKLVRGGVTAVVLDGGTALLSAAEPARCRAKASRPECTGVRLARLPKRIARQTGSR